MGQRETTGKINTLSSSQQGWEKSSDKGRGCPASCGGRVRSCKWWVGCRDPEAHRPLALRRVRPLGTAQLSQTTPQIQLTAGTRLTSSGASQSCNSQARGSPMVAMAPSSLQAPDKPHHNHHPAASLVQEPLSFCLESETIKLF